MELYSAPQNAVTHSWSLSKAVPCSVLLLALNHCSTQLNPLNPYSASLQMYVPTEFYLFHLQSYSDYRYLKFTTMTTEYYSYHSTSTVYYNASHNAQFELC